MTHQENLEQTEEGRTLITPHAQCEPASETAPLSNRCYNPLEAVQRNVMEKAAALRDNDTTVVTPIGGLIPIGRADDEVGGFVLDDVVAIPQISKQYSQVLSYCQVPIMIDDKPALERDGTQEIDFGRLPVYQDYADSVNGQEKAVEQVLSIPTWPFIKQMIDPEHSFKPADLSAQVYGDLAYLRRGWCEKDERFIQLLPYITFWKIIDNRIYLFVYQRGQGVGEGRLAMNCSVGVGGHVNPIDFLSVQSHLVKIETPAGPDIQSVHSGRMFCDAFWNGILTNVFRECDEEVLVTVMEQGGPKEVPMVQWVNEMAAADDVSLEQWLYRRTTFFLDYAASEVERHHLNMSIAIQVPENFEIATAEDELIDVGFVDLDILFLHQQDASSQLLPTPLEHWSRAVVDSLYSTIEFFNKNNPTLVSSTHVREAMRANGDHPTNVEDIAKIPHADRWKIGTLAGSFDQKYSLYAMNAFVRA